MPARCRYCRSRRHRAVPGRRHHRERRRPVAAMFVSAVWRMSWNGRTRPVIPAAVSAFWTARRTTCCRRGASRASGARTPLETVAESCRPRVPPPQPRRGAGLTALGLLHDRDRGERWALRWLSRYLTERPTVTLDDVRSSSPVCAHSAARPHADALAALLGREQPAPNGDFRQMTQVGQARCPWAALRWRCAARCSSQTGRACGGRLVPGGLAGRSRAFGETAARAGVPGDDCPASPAQTLWVDRAP